MKTTLSNAYRQNRAKFCPEELQKVDGQWVAFSADGQQIVAHAAKIAELSNRVRAVQLTMGDVVLEHVEIESDEISLGAAGLL